MMKKAVGSNYQDTPRLLFIAQIVAVACLVGFLHIDLKQMGT